MNTNKLVLDLEDNEELRDALSSKAPGDECELTVKAKIDEITPTQAVLSVTEAEVEGDDYEGKEADVEGEPAETRAGEPAPVLIALGKKSKPQN